MAHLSALHIGLVSQEYPPETGWGGIGTYTYHLAHGLTQAGCQVDVVSLSIDGADHVYLDRQVRVHRLATRRIPLKLGRRWFGFINLLDRSYTVARCLRALVREAGVQVVDAPNWDAEAFCYTWSGRAPLVVHTVTPLVESARIEGRKPSLDLRARLWLERATVRRADRVIALSASIAAANQAHYAIPLSAMSVIPLALAHHGDAERVLEARRDERRPRTVLFVGRLELRKGIQYVLEAIPQVLSLSPETRFVLAGRDSATAPGGKFWQEYFRETCPARWQSAVTFAGFVPENELQQLYLHCDVFLAPSLYESFGLVHLEAMSWGAPVVAFRAAATPEVVLDGETGILAEPGDVAGLTQAVVRLLSDPDLRREMGWRALAWAGQFSVERMVEQTVAVYREVLAH